MKRLLLLVPVFVFHSIMAQNVGIGTSNPLEKLHVEGAAFLNGNVGIGISAPAFPLSFAPVTGDKISLWSNSANSYGFGVQPSLLQIYTDVSTADIAFGYGSSAAFTERMRIKGTGQIGLGVNDPLFAVDMMGRIRIRTGIDGEPGIWLNSADNSNLQAFVGLENNNNVGFYSASGAGWGLAMNTGNGNVKIMSRLGIGLATPDFPLSFPGSTGDKISLWSDGSASHYGLGIQGGLLQVFTKSAVDDVAFGYGSSGAFTETMRIKGNGNVGIGNTNPSFQFDLSNRMRIRSGGNNSVSAGLWLNNNTNDLAAFIGMEDDTHVGFFGIGTGWKFGMNTQTGGLKINGTEGQQGQVLVSNGSSAAAGYTTIGNVIGTDIKLGSGVVSVNAIFTDFHLPVLTHTLTLARRSRVLISANASFNGSFCLGCVTAVGNFKLRINGTELTTQIYAVPATAAGNASFCNFMWTLDPGVHSIDFYVRCSDGPIHTVTPKYSSVIILPVD